MLAPLFVLCVNSELGQRQPAGSRVSFPARPAGWYPRETPPPCQPPPPGPSQRIDHPGIAGGHGGAEIWGPRRVPHTTTRAMQHNADGTKRFAWCDAWGIGLRTTRAGALQ